MKKLILISALSVALALFLAGCQNTTGRSTSSAPFTPDKAADTNPKAPEAIDEGGQGAPGSTLANPASANCQSKGGRLEMRSNKKGQYGVCLFDDNRQCEEWALMRGQCPVGGVKVTGYENDSEVYCAITGGTIEGLGAPTTMCKRVDGTLCAAQANLDGDCPDPNDPNPDAGNAEMP